MIHTERSRSFQRSHIVETGLSDFHKMTATVMKIYFKTQGPRVIYHRDYKRFNVQSFCLDLFASLHKENVNIKQLEKFLNVFEKVF